MCLWKVHKKEKLAFPKLAKENKSKKVAFTKEFLTKITRLALIDFQDENSKTVKIQAIF